MSPRYQHHAARSSGCERTWHAHPCTRSARSGPFETRHGAYGERQDVAQGDLCDVVLCHSVLIVEEFQFELPDVRWVGDQVDGDNLAVPDGEVDDNARRPARRPDSPWHAIDEGWFRGLGTAREGLCHRRRTYGLPIAAHRHGDTVGADHGVRIEQRDKRLEVTDARGRQKGVDNCSLAVMNDGGICVRALYPAAGSARELPCRGRGALHDERDLVKRYREHVVQHEGEALGGSQRFKHHQHRLADRVRQERLMLWVSVAGTAHERLRHVIWHPLLAS